MSESPDGTWLAPILTAVVAVTGGLIALLRRVFTSVTREEMVDAIREIEARFTATMDDLKKEQLRMHEENRSARHALGNQLSTPVNNLTLELARFRQAVDEMNRRGG